MEVLAAANACAAAGTNVLHLELGEPGATLPEVVKRDVVAALDEAPLGYTEALGTKALRAGIAELYADWYGVRVDPGRIAVTTGASGAFVLALLAAFDPGQRIAMAEPGYPAYKTLVGALDLQPVAIRTARESGFQPTPADLAHVSPIDGLILASPANPTGSLLDDTAVDGLLASCHHASVRVIMDEIYHGLVFAGGERTIVGRADDALVINSFSKYFGLTGWRLGWLVMPDALVEPIERLAQSLFISPPAIAQHAGLAALRHRGAFAGRRDVYAANWQTLRDGLVRGGVAANAIVEADGAFYLYADLSAFTSDSIAFCKRLLGETGVAATPGVDFDPTRGHRFVRFSVAGTTDTVRSAADHLAAWLPTQRRDDLG
ncbi:MAG: aminotransferase class I/II-fold pyridoxal phosphate-dependent enzyme [Pseudomonadota bacterium]